MILSISPHASNQLRIAHIFQILCTLPSHPNSFNCAYLLLSCYFPSFSPSCCVLPNGRRNRFDECSATPPTAVISHLVQKWIDGGGGMRRWRAGTLTDGHEAPEVVRGRAGTVPPPSPHELAQHREQTLAQPRRPAGLAPPRLHGTIRPSAPGLAPALEPGACARGVGVVVPVPMSSAPVPTLPPPPLAPCVVVLVIVVVVLVVVVARGRLGLQHLQLQRFVQLHGSIATWRPRALLSVRRRDAHCPGAACDAVLRDICTRRRSTRRTTPASAGRRHLASITTITDSYRGI